VMKMYQVAIRNDEGFLSNCWFDTLVQAESYVLGFNSSANDGRRAMVVPFH
jgi:hypothetical protein